MNSYLFEQIGRARREALIDDAAANRLATEMVAADRMIEDRPHRGFWDAVRRAFTRPAGDGDGFVPRLLDYPTARH